MGRPLGSIETYFNISGLIKGSNLKTGILDILYRSIISDLQVLKPLGISS